MRNARCVTGACTWSSCMCVLCQKKTHEEPPRGGVAGEAQPVARRRRRHFVPEDAAILTGPTQRHKPHTRTMANLRASPITRPTLSMAAIAVSHAPPPRIPPYQARWLPVQRAVCEAHLWRSTYAPLVPRRHRRRGRRAPRHGAAAVAREAAPCCSIAVAACCLRLCAPDPRKAGHVGSRRRSATAQRRLFFSHGAAARACSLILMYSHRARPLSAPSRAPGAFELWDGPARLAIFPT